MIKLVMTTSLCDIICCVGYLNLSVIYFSGKMMAFRILLLVLFSVLFVYHLDM